MAKWSFTKLFNTKIFRAGRRMSWTNPSLERVPQKVVSCRNPLIGEKLTTKALTLLLLH